MAISIRNSLRNVVLERSELPESLWCKLYVRDMSCIIGCVYRPPLSSIVTLSDVRNCLAKFKANQHRVILEGD